MRTDLDAIKNAKVPVQRALSMAQAIAQYLRDLDTDDSGDAEAQFAPRLRRAQGRADALVTALHSMLKT